MISILAVGEQSIYWLSLCISIYHIVYVAHIHPEPVIDRINTLYYHSDESMIRMTEMNRTTIATTTETTGWRWMQAHLQTSLIFTFSAEFAKQINHWNSRKFFLYVQYGTIREWLVFCLLLSPKLYCVLDLMFKS